MFTVLCHADDVAEIEEVRGLSRGALDPEFDAEEDAAREMYSQSDL